MVRAREFAPVILTHNSGRDSFICGSASVRYRWTRKIENRRPVLEQPSNLAQFRGSCIGIGPAVGPIIGQAWRCRIRVEREMHKSLAVRR
jgi:hypothetical protein